MIVRHACKEDCAAIGEIYNHAVLHTSAIWNDKTVDTDNRIAWFEARSRVTRFWSAKKTALSPATPLLATGARLTVFAIRLSTRFMSTRGIRAKALAVR